MEVNEDYHVCPIFVLAATIKKISKLTDMKLAVRCQKESCAWWNELRNECGIKPVMELGK